MSQLHALKVIDMTKLGNNNWSKKQQWWCRVLGHNWCQTYHSGYLSLYDKERNKKVKFIGTYCKRCFKGYAELIDMVKRFASSSYNSHSDKYFNE